MKRSIALLILFSSALMLQVSAQCGLNLLSNPDFETPVAIAMGSSTPKAFIFKGWKSEGFVKTGGNDAAFTARDGAVFVGFDSNGGALQQDFIITGKAVPVSYGGYFSANGGVPTGSIIEVYAISGNTLTLVSTSDSIRTPAPGHQHERWYEIRGSVTLNAGTYRYVSHVGALAGFDAAFVFQNCNMTDNLGQISGTLLNGIFTADFIATKETRNDHFDIEISEDGQLFTKIGRITSKAPDGMSSKPISYHFKTSGNSMMGILGVYALVLGFILMALLFTNRNKFLYAMVLSAGIGLLGPSSCSREESPDLKTLEKQNILMRIVQVDKDGSAAYSSIAKVRND